MDIRENVSLRDYSTMRLGGNARYLLEIHERQQMAEAVSWAKLQSLPFIVIGGGSNIFWQDTGFDGLVIVNKILKYEDFAEDDSNHYVTIGAGENWDSVVQRTVEVGLTGIECLSLIPGSAGGTPVQNVGAYGQEISNTLTTVELYDTQTDSFLTMPGYDCGFGYRTSRFKTTDKGRYCITALTLHLSVGNPEPPFYAGLEAYLEEHHISEYTPATIREAVIAIRSAKLPNPAEVANNGSFFANPVVDNYTYTQIAADFGDDMPHWEVDNDQVKLAAAWLVDKAGFKDFHDPETGMGTWPNQALVLVNEHAESTAQLLAFRDKIISTVQEKFGVTLQQEPELLP
ncbi:UDP-N-acetylmuramate dehydrogenase [Candidatus Saccharibacteria bacterium]|nr:UDP-N-acetylmuramate dehydrogenase [Candidatus Saccharibacteria bacterium]